MRRAMDIDSKQRILNTRVRSDKVGSSSAGCPTAFPLVGELASSYYLDPRFNLT